MLIGLSRLGVEIDRSMNRRGFISRGLAALAGIACAPLARVASGKARLVGPHCSIKCGNIPYGECTDPAIIAHIKPENRTQNERRILLRHMQGFS
jgi:hypothetical protein